MPTIQVSEVVKGDLDDVKEAEQHTSYDSVIRSLLREYGEGTSEPEYLGGGPGAWKEKNPRASELFSLDQ